MRGIAYEPSRFKVAVDPARCKRCGACVAQCGWDVFSMPRDGGLPVADEQACRGCQRCAAFCPAGAIEVSRRPDPYAPGAGWDAELRRRVRLQAETGGALLSSMGSDRLPLEVFDHLLLDACQVTNPPIDPLREPMELDTFLGPRPERVEVERRADGGYRLAGGAAGTPALRLATPVMFAAMSLGSISLPAQQALARAAASRGVLMNAGEGGVHESLLPYAGTIVLQFASGRFGVSASTLRRCAAIEIKIGQGAKPGIGGHLPASKIDGEIARTRMIPAGVDAISPAPHHDIYSIEDLRQLIESIKEVSEGRPVGVKIAAVHNVAAIASGAVHAGAEWVTVDGFTGATGAAPIAVRDNVGLPLAVAVAAVDQRLREEGLRQRASIVASGSIRSAGDLAKAILLGADCAAVGTAALVALGCRVCRGCHTGCCPWGIATQRPELTRRLDAGQGALRLENLLDAWTRELTEIMGAMGVNAIESLRGNRDRLRALELTDRLSDALGVAPVGR